MKQVTGKSQHGFTKGQSYHSNTITFYNNTTSSVSIGRAVDVVYVDFNKALDTFPWPSPGQTGKIHIGWVICEMGRKLANRLRSEGSDRWLYSGWQHVTSRVLQGPILSPTLFNIFINDLDDGIESTLTKFSDDTKLGFEEDMTEGRAILQRHLGRVEEWVSKTTMKFNKDNHKVLHL